MDQTEIRDRILLAVLPHAAFDGWNQRALAAGLADAGLPPDAAVRAFPAGVREIVAHWSSFGDRRMVDALAQREQESTRVRDRVAAAVRIRIEVNSAYREAVRRGLSFLALPQNADVAARCIRDTVDAIWYAIGDTSSDFSYYTKRASLTAVYGVTILYWLDDTSDGGEDTWAFLDRRVDGMMKVPELQARITGAIERLAGPLSSRAGRGFRVRRSM